MSSPPIVRTDHETSCPAFPLPALNLTVRDCLAAVSGFERSKLIKPVSGCAFAHLSNLAQIRKAPPVIIYSTRVHEAQQLYSASDRLDSFAYQDANYGYTGYYIDQDEYNYYFRRGFRHGYEDGFNSRYQYGQYSNGSYIVLEVTLGQILGFQPLR